MSLSMVPRLRLVRRCRACSQDIDPTPETALPRSAATGQVDAEMCIKLGICPLCRTCSGIDFDTTAINRIRHRLWVLAKQREGK